MIDFDFSAEKYGPAAELLQTLAVESVATQLVLSALLRQFPTLLAQRDHIDRQLEVSLLALPLTDLQADRIRATVLKLLT